MRLSKHGVSDLQNSDLDREIKINRARDFLVFIPVLLAGFFLTPAFDMPSVQVVIFGLPLKYFTIFLFWLFAIIVIAAVNRRLARYVSEREK